MKAFTFLVFLCFSLAAAGQIRSVTVQVGGLTCAMCSRAVQKSMEKVAFIKQVQPNFKTQEYTITFREGQSISLDEIKKSIEGAGFSVARFQLSAQFDNMIIRAGQPLALGAQHFYILNTADETLDGVRTLVIVEKGFLTAKGLKNYCGTGKLKCLEPARGAASESYHAVMEPAKQPAS